MLSSRVLGVLVTVAGGVVMGERALLDLFGVRCSAPLFDGAKRRSTPWPSKAAPSAALHLSGVHLKVWNRA